jgi:NADH-quinone oxidoreductase subunit C
MEEQELLTSVEAKLRENFGDAIISAEMMRNFPVFTIKKDRIVDVIKYLYDDPEMEFRFLTDLCGIHFPDNKGQELGVVYHLHNMPKNWRVRLRIFFGLNAKPTISTE